MFISWTEEEREVPEEGPHNVQAALMEETNLLGRKGNVLRNENILQQAGMILG